MLDLFVSDRPRFKMIERQWWDRNNRNSVHSVGKRDSLTPGNRASEQKMGMRLSVKMDYSGRLAVRGFLRLYTFPTFTEVCARWFTSGSNERDGCSYPGSCDRHVIGLWDLYLMTVTWTPDLITTWCINRINMILIVWGEVHTHFVIAVAMHHRRLYVATQCIQRKSALCIKLSWVRLG